MYHDICKDLINGIINPSNNELVPFKLLKRRRSSFFLYTDKMLSEIPYESGQYSNSEIHLGNKQTNNKIIEIKIKIRTTTPHHPNQTKLQALQIAYK